MIVDKSWQESHWNKIKQNYSKAKCFNEYKTIFEDLYRNINTNQLSKLILNLLEL